MTDPRWLDREAAAAYVGRRVDELPRLVKAGKLPLPSYHFGPRSPRYDRLALDALFTGRQGQDDVDAIVEAGRHALRAENEGRAKTSRRRGRMRNSAESRHG